MSLSPATPRIPSIDQGVLDEVRASAFHAEADLEHVLLDGGDLGRGSARRPGPELLSPNDGDAADARRVSHRDHALRRVDTLARLLVSVVRRRGRRGQIVRGASASFSRSWSAVSRTT
ncbi:hypothetical protein [Arenivirga flava]|uniref:Uncharacterized protein n=1 Tax=Arenivirga flava TaxID=1930060 RepID=A0AA37XAH3_9MICO|nr:hypothetical protein [Arenivirga flava]GMA27436.1 hypothetical protein GCM10025874_06890 [Arenivirga flava]